LHGVKRDHRASLDAVFLGKGNWGMKMHPIAISRSMEESAHYGNSNKLLFLPALIARRFITFLSNKLQNALRTNAGEAIDLASDSLAI